MIHNIKFKHEKKAALDLGYLIGNKLYAEAEWIKDIDLILPVPLHKYRKYSRGYNQSEELSRGLNHSFNKEIDITSVIRHKRRKPQVKTSSYDERWENTKDLFHVVAPEKLEGKHILIVDDVVTTGATTISLIETIKAAAADVKISVLALSSTRKS
ncbi:MAG: phosphoribosyltransferase family protein [Rikenellaceae bacterium]